MKLSLNDISFRYAEKEVLENLFLSVESHQTVLIEGPSGSGKSTLLALLAGLLPCQRGEIIWDETRFSALNQHQRADFRRKHFAYSHQDSHLVEHWTVEQNLGLVTQDRNAMRETLESLHLTASLETRASRLSGGEKQRVSIARALLKPHCVLFLDEPTSHLDDRSTTRFIEQLSVSKKPRTVFLVSHDHRLRDRIPTRFKLEKVSR